MQGCGSGLGPPSHGGASLARTLLRLHQSLFLSGGLGLFSPHRDGGWVSGLIFHQLCLGVGAFLSD